MRSTEQCNERVFPNTSQDQTGYPYKIYTVTAFVIFRIDALSLKIDSI